MSMNRPVLNKGDVVYRVTRSHSSNWSDVEPLVLRIELLDRWRDCGSPVKANVGGTEKFVYLSGYEPRTRDEAINRFSEGAARAMNFAVASLGRARLDLQWVEREKRMPVKGAEA